MDFNKNASAIKEIFVIREATLPLIFYNTRVFNHSPSISVSSGNGSDRKSISYMIIPNE